MQIKTTSFLWSYSLFFMLLLTMLGCWFYQENQTVEMHSPQHLVDNKLQCVSYAPYYGKGQSPFIEGMWITPAQIDQDLALLARISHCVRTYSVGQGMDYVPEAASKLGMKVYLGAWVGWTEADNIKEIKLASAKANAYSDTVKALIIGNEVFLRGEQNENAMRRYLRLAKSLSNTPITYADVWEFWVKHKDIAKDVDFHTVHILPYWENNPVAIEDATQHAENVMQNMQIHFTKPILIGETGWPSVGRQRNESRPSLVNQARYVREFLQKAEEKQWQYNIIEAIDQPWKRVLEGTVGGYWGVISANLEPKFSLTEPVTERKDGRVPVYIGLVGALFFLSIALTLRERRVNVLLGLIALGSLTALTSYLEVEYLIAACRDWIEWFSLGGLALLGLLVVLTQPWLIIQSNPWALNVMRLLKLVFLYAALMTGYLIFVDGRYRDFPIVIFALPTLVLAINYFAGVYVSHQRWLSVGIPSALTVIFAALCAIREFNNNTALIWLGLAMVIAVVNWPSQLNKNNENQV
ncbi:MAG: beta (1-6) glucan synthase [Methylophilaceae bacterium]|nr:MAG: beta (1-6) glucan synthase [Methylophilaceae bacterium]